MSDVNVLVVFHSRYGSTEKSALAAGVGAIEAEGNIRLRRLPDEAPAAALAADPEWRAARGRMDRDYVAPRPADPPWADVIVLASPPESSDLVCGYVATLPALALKTNVLVAPLSTRADAACLGPLAVALANAGLMAVPHVAGGVDPVTSARLHGQRLVRLARALKSAS